MGPIRHKQTEPEEARHQTRNIGTTYEVSGEGTPTAHLEVFKVFGRISVSENRYSLERKAGFW